jgi:hypothetical protein
LIRESKRAAWHRRHAFYGPAVSIRSAQTSSITQFIDIPAAAADKEQEAQIFAPLLSRSYANAFFFARAITIFDFQTLRMENQYYFWRRALSSKQFYDVIMSSTLFCYQQLKKYFLEGSSLHPYCKKLIENT